VLTTAFTLPTAGLAFPGLSYAGGAVTIIGIDDSGSMSEGHRLSSAVMALKHWSQSAATGAPVVVDLVGVSDHLTPLGTFALGNAGEFNAFFAALDAIKAKRHTRTLFRMIDADLAALVDMKAKANVDVAVAIISDGVSDEPSVDLELIELGDTLVELGSGVFASLSAGFPDADSLKGTAGSVHPPKVAGHPRSRLRQTLSANISFSVPAPLEGKLRAKLLGGYEPVRVPLQVRNDGTFPRELRLHVKGPSGSTTSIAPNTLFLQSHGRAAAAVYIEGYAAVIGEISVTAESSKLTVAQTSFRSSLSPEPWALSNWRLLGTGAGLSLLLVIVFWRMSGRPILLTPVGQNDPAIELRRRDVVPVAMFAQGFPADVVIGRGALFGWLFVKTAGIPVLVNGLPIPVDVAIRYRLRSAIEAAGVVVVLDELHRSQFLPASAFLSP
jgi:hypothetical protein